MQKTSIYSAVLLLTSAAILNTSGRAQSAPDAVPKAAATLQECGVDVHPQDLPNGDYGGFYTWPELVGEIDGWLRKYPHLVRAQRLGTSVEGRAIPLLKISSNPEKDEDKPEVLYLVGIHPREQAPTVAIVRFVSELLAGYNTNPEITQLVNSREIWVVPMLNVDGKIYDFQHGNTTTRGADWRKNRRVNPDGTIGVDLNRNFPIRWGGNRAYDESWKASTADTKGNIYEGSAPASEPETRAIMEFITARPLRAMVDLHSPLHDLRAPGFLSASEHSIYLDLLQKMQKSQKDPYPLKIGKPGVEPKSETRGGDSGTSYPWSYYTTGAYSFNIEMGFKGRNGEYSTGVGARYASAASVETEYADNIRGPLLTLLRESGDLQPATQGSAKLLQSGWEGAPKAGARVMWKPQITRDFDYAVAMSESAAGVIPLEFRLAPAGAGFSIQIQPNAKSGTPIPLSLYVWKGRERSIFKTELVVQ
ncbi:MAG: hypothetical protein KY445_00425 [Armatimonadetes bacterium]|nr:hypothetical protein [Armatimonadota bacterium]